MNGGTEKPCMRPVVLAKYAAQTGFPCPERRLDPDNAVALDLVSIAYSEATRPFSDAALRMAIADGEDERLLLGRITHALRHPVVVKHLYPDQSEAVATKEQ